MLDVQDITVAYSSNAEPTIEGFHLEMKPGEICSIVGESGSGKTTVIRSILGLLPSGGKVTKGDILFEGESLLQYSKKQWRELRGTQISMIFQDSMTSLNPTMRVGRQMCEGILRHQRVSRQEAQQISAELLGQVGLPNPELVAKRYPHTMSGGQRQRVMIAMAMACNPKILFADEPTTALDVTMQAQILDLMNHLKEKRGTSILLITHDLGVVAKMADRIAVMYAGKIVEYGDARQVFYRPSHPYTWGLLGAMPNLIQDVKSELYAIPGTPPDLYAPPKGCAFAARCPYAMEACLKEDPPEFACGQGHGSRCWLLDPRAPDVTPPEGIPPLPKGGSDHV